MNRHTVSFLGLLPVFALAALAVGCAAAPSVDAVRWEIARRIPEARFEPEEHIRLGREYPSVDLNTSYSFGLDDQEFVVAFETDNPADFLDLVQRLRTTESSSYTLRDTPTFTCISCSVERALGALDGAALTLTELS